MRKILRSIRLPSPMAMLCVVLFIAMICDSGVLPKQQNPVLEGQKKGSLQSTIDRCAEGSLKDDLAIKMCVHKDLSLELHSEFGNRLVGQAKYQAGYDNAA